MKRSLLVCSLSFVVAELVVSGCGSGGRPTVETVKVSGTVKLGGSALDGADVNFVGEKYAGFATTDSSGHYELEAQPGENIVFIQKFEGVDPDFDETMMDVGDADDGGAGAKQLVPKKFSDESKTELKFSVPDDGADNADFDLSSK